MKNTFELGDELIDSRDVISRLEELEDELGDLTLELEDTRSELSMAKAKRISLHMRSSASESEKEALDELIEKLENEVDYAEFFLNDWENKDEYDDLISLSKQGENSSDWSYGETLILETYFTQYIKELISDCYEFPEELDRNQWPWRHLKMNWEDAAEEALVDYSEICVGRYTYLIRA